MEAKTHTRRLLEAIDRELAWRIEHVPEERELRTKQQQEGRKELEAAH